MSIRLVITVQAAPGKKDELVQAYLPRCAEISQEPGCEQYEVFVSAVNPNRLVLLERWRDQEALDVHAKNAAKRAPLDPSLRVGAGEREDYEYRRTR